MFWCYIVSSIIALNALLICIFSVHSVLNSDPLETLHLMPTLYQANDNKHRKWTVEMVKINRNVLRKKPSICHWNSLPLFYIFKMNKKRLLPLHFRWKAAINQTFSNFTIRRLFAAIAIKPLNVHHFRFFFCISNGL